MHTPLPCPTAPSTHTSCTPLSPVSQRRGRLSHQHVGSCKTLECGVWEEHLPQKNKIHTTVAEAVEVKTKEGKKNKPIWEKKISPKYDKDTGNWQKVGQAQVERRKNEASLFLIPLVFGAAWQKVRQGQQDQSFKCSSVLAQPCVSTLGGSTKSCRPVQHGNSDLTVQPIKTHLPPWCKCTPQPADGLSKLTVAQLSTYIV